MDFSNKIAVITGAATGIGRAVAIRLAKNGAVSVIMDRDGERLAAVKSEIEGFGGKVVVLCCDISDEQQVNAAIGEALTSCGKIDILVNNAAVWRSFKPFCDISSDEWKAYLNINVLGTVYCTKAVLPSMLENGYGKIINVSSVAGVYGNANMAHYSATKGAVIALTKALAKEVSDKGICVNCVSPGSVSPSNVEDMDYYESSELSFMGRTGTDNENADLICFLASNKASYISGQNIQIDGCRKKM